MRFGGTPFVEEGLKTHFSQRTILRTYLAIPGALALALLVAWPQGTTVSVLRGSAMPDAFSTVAVAFLLLLLYFCGRYGAEEYSPDTVANLREYVTLTPASTASLVGGKAAFAILHTAFLLVLGTPFLVTAYAVSGARAGSFMTALAVLAAAALSARMYGLLLLALFGPRKLVRGTVFLASLVAFLVGTYLLLPAINPVSVLLSARDAAGQGTTGPLSPPALLVVVDLAASGVLAATVALVLLAERRRARSRGGA